MDMIRKIEIILQVGDLKQEQLELEYAISRFLRNQRDLVCSSYIILQAERLKCDGSGINDVKNLKFAIWGSHGREDVYWGIVSCNSV
jgi:hypothetical protein